MPGGTWRDVMPMSKGTSGSTETGFCLATPRRKRQCQALTSLHVLWAYHPILSFSYQHDCFTVNFPNIVSD
uniref:Uncharacterized protein n=1 Tax=Triticum urartu TaxID=4572 RepID=A0A8R7R4P2_TRIUA